MMTIMIIIMMMTIMMMMFNNNNNNNEKRHDEDLLELRVGFARKEIPVEPGGAGREPYGARRVGRAFRFSAKHPKDCTWNLHILLTCRAA